MPTSWVDAMASVDPGTEVIPGITAGDMLFAMRPGSGEGLRHGRSSYAGGAIHWWAPEAPGSYPGVVLVHGGSWSSGDASMHWRHAHDLAHQGFVAATVDYRLIPAVPWPVPLDDVRAALRWLRADPLGLGVDAARVSVAGGSAGAHLAALAALLPGGDPPLAAAVLWYPPVRLRSTREVPDLGSVVEATFGDALDEWSPLAHVHGGAPPVLTMTGDADPVLPVADARAFHDALTGAGVPNELVVYDDPRHGFDLTERWYDDSFARLAGWLGTQSAIAGRAKVTERK